MNFSIPLPFAPSQNLLDLYADWQGLVALHAEASMLPSFKAFAARVTAQLEKDVSAANNAMTAVLHFEIGKQYCDALRKLARADERAIDTLNKGFLTADEREVANHFVSHPVALLDVWAKDAATLAFDKALLEKYAEAIAADTSTYKKEGAYIDRDGHCDELETDYSAVIAAAQKINQKGE